MMDKFALRARVEGYRARSVFKLNFINKKYHLIRKNYKILDLGCYPGSWMQYCSNSEAFVVGVDIKKINSIPHTRFIFGNIKDNKIVKEIEKYGKYDLVLSDLSPNISGNRVLDQARNIELCQVALNISKKVLKRNGNFVFKIFQGENFNEFLKEVKEYFNFVKSVKPEASKKSSKEMYIICLGYKS